MRPASTSISTSTSLMVQRFDTWLSMPRALALGLTRKGDPVSKIRVLGARLFSHEKRRDDQC